MTLSLQSKADVGAWPLRARRSSTARQLHHASQAFTLLEMLFVIGVISLLLAITLPAIGRVNRAADRARTLAWFADWAAAMELFRQEYGYFPDLTADTGSSGRIDADRFLAALTGRDRDGAPVSLSASAGNRRALTFLTLPSASFDAEYGELLDGFGNRDVAVLIDTNGDGRISGSELVKPELRRGSSAVGLTAAGAPPSEAFPVNGVRGSIAFYSAGSQAWIFSWE